MKTRKIRVLLGPDSTREVDAVIYGPFGIHRTIVGWNDFHGNYYTVSHLATGYAAATDAASKKSALRLARMLARCGVNWKFTKVPKRFRTSAMRARDVVERWSKLEAAK
jgi:hypothetical protein